MIRQEHLISDPLDEHQVNKPNSYTGIYGMHKYWSKKPASLVGALIASYSHPGDIVLDSFCGSGVVIIQSVVQHRRAIGFDINPVAISITRLGLERVDTGALEREFKQVQSELAKLERELYSTTCPNCGSDVAITTHCIWNGGSVEEVWYSCPTCRTDGRRPGTALDAKKAIDPCRPPSWYPDDQLIENSRLCVRSGMRVSDLFTPRALVALSNLLDRIRQIESRPIRETLEMCFTGALSQASKMVFVIRRRGKMNGAERMPKAEVGSWVIGYWVPQEHFEINVMKCFENRFRKVLRGKREVNRIIPPLVRQCSSYEQLVQSEQGYWIAEGSATKLPLPSESIDYVLIDPPHGNRVLYLEQSLMWNAWLGKECDWEDEIVVSESPVRSRNLSDYALRLGLAFSELHRVLKTGRYCSAMFNSLDDETWEAFVTAWVRAGFSVEKIMPLDYSARSVVQDTRENALKTDFVITGRKLEATSSSKLVLLNDNDTIRVDIEEALDKHQGKAQTYEILNWVISKRLAAGELPKISSVVKVLKEEYSCKNGHWCRNV